MTSIAIPWPAAALTSATVPWVTQRPRLRMATRSQVCWISESRWLETSTVRPSAANRRRSSRTLRIPAGSSPFAGSSRISSAGSLSSAAGESEPLAHAERVLPHRVAGPLGRARPPRAPDRPGAGRCDRSRRATSGCRARSSWGTSPATRRLRRRCGIDSARPSGTGRPSSRTAPLVGRTRPRTQRIVVVFPEPLGPRKPNTPPSGTTRSRPSTATTRRRARPYSLRSPSISMTFVPMGHASRFGFSADRRRRSPPRVTSARRKLAPSRSLSPPEAARR